MDSFSIDANDILESCLNVGKVDEDYFDHLFLWIDEKVEAKLEKEETIKILQKLSLNYSEAKTFNDIEAKIDEFENVGAKELALDGNTQYNLPQYEISGLEHQTYTKGLIHWKAILGVTALAMALLAVGLATRNVKLSAPVVKMKNQGLIARKVVAQKKVGELHKNKAVKEPIKEIAVKEQAVKKEVPVKKLEKAKIFWNNLETIYQFHEINRVKLKEYLHSKNSLLAEEPYFSAIDNTAKKYNINTLLLFAITAAEQSFVPKGGSSAKLIANNPFNVYHSWQEYNTSIYDSSEIAARTIVNTCKYRPQSVDSIKWLNKNYSESSGWWISVKQFFESLSSYTM